MLFSSFALANTPVAMLSDPLQLDATCSCGSAADCTCKKGACKCAKCGQHHQKAKMFESLKPVDAQLPNTARLDATAGVFI